MLLTKEEVDKRMNAIKSTLKSSPHTLKLVEEIVKSHNEALNAIWETDDPSKV